MKVIMVANPAAAPAAERGVERRYTGVAQALHWLTAALIFTILPVAWVMTSLPHGDPRVNPTFDFHKSLGVTIFALVVARLVWRALHPPPPLLNEPAPLQWLGKASHWALYAVLLYMPVTGYLLSAASPYGVHWFGVPLPSLPRDDGLSKAAGVAHVLGQWLVYATVGMHLLATLWHVWLRRDGVLDRMLPAQTNAPPMADQG